MNNLPKMKLFNLGMSTAKNIEIVWDDKNNLEELKKAYNIDIDYSLDNDRYKIAANGTEIYYPYPLIQKVTFIRNTSEADYNIAFPISYYTLMENYIMDGKWKQPTYRAKIRYEDIQNVQYIKEIEIIPEIEIMSLPEDKDGYCKIHYMVNELSEKKTRLFSWSNIFLEGLLVIILVAQIITMVEYFLMKKHKMNSISELHQTLISGTKSTACPKGGD